VTVTFFPRLRRAALSNKTKKLRKVTVTIFYPPTAGSTSKRNQKVTKGDSHPFFDSHLFYPPTAGSTSKRNQKVTKGDSHLFLTVTIFPPTKKNRRLAPPVFSLSYKRSGSIVVEINNSRGRKCLIIKLKISISRRC
jgi:hypothetical protein